jgi:ketosteroid isomerase-like protein
MFGQKGGSVNDGRVVLSLLVAALMVGGTVGPASAADREAEKAVVAKVVHDSICWALTKDRALQESTMAHDEDLFIIWTDSKATTAGWKQYVKLFDTWMDPRFKATVTEVRDLRIHLSRSGDVAWYSAMLDDLGEWDGKPTGSRDIRWTGVLEKRRGKWVVVQMHGSVAADKASDRPKPE